MLQLQEQNKLIQTLNTLKINDKITVIGFNSFGFPQVSQTRFHSVKTSENYFQQFVYLIHKPKRKRTYFKKSLDHKDIIILNGWYDIDTKNAMQAEQIGNTTYEMWTSFDDTFLKEIALLYENETLFQSVL